MTAPGSPDDQGPVFPNPYLSNVLIASYVRSGAAMVGLSRDGGNTFCDSTALTALLTDSGRLPLMSSSAISTHFSEVGSTYHGPNGGSNLTPVSVDFDRADPLRVYVAGVGARVFTADLRLSPADVLGKVSCPEPVWHDLSSAIKAPLPYLSAIRSDGDKLYLSTQGRGVLEMHELGRARKASWFLSSAKFGATQPLASLQSGAGAIVPYGFVTARFTPMPTCSGASSFEVSQRTGPDGALVISGGATGCEYRVDLEFRSDGETESTSTRIRSTKN